MATRTMLFSGCWAVSVEPPVCAWKGSAWAFGFVAPNRSRMISAQSRRAARNFATSWKKWVCALKKNERRLPDSSGETPADAPPVGGCEPGPRARWRPRLADVVPGDRDRVPLRQPLPRIREEIRRQAHRRLRREDVISARAVLLEDVVLDGSAKRGARDALLLGHELVQQQEQRGRRVDRHRRRDLAQRDPVEKKLHGGDRVY